jgi:hypothetical protein
VIPSVTLTVSVTGQKVTLTVSITDYRVIIMCRGLKYDGKWSSKNDFQVITGGKPSNYSVGKQIID